MIFDSQTKEMNRTLDDKIDENNEYFLIELSGSPKLTAVSLCDTPDKISSGNDTKFDFLSSATVTIVDDGKQEKGCS